MGTGCSRHTSTGKWINCATSTRGRCGVGSCSRLQSESVLNEKQSLDSPALWLWDKAPFQAGVRSQDALLWPTDQCCWPSGTQPWHQTSSDKKDSCLKQLLLHAWCLLQVTSMFFHITVCCRQVEWFLGFDIAALPVMKATLQTGLLRYGNLQHSQGTVSVPK